MCSSAMLSTTGTSARGGSASLPRTSAMTNSANVAIAERMAMVHSAEKLSSRTLFTGHTRPHGQHDSDQGGHAHAPRGVLARRGAPHRAELMRRRTST